MKNLSLAFIVILLLGVTYFTQEYLPQKEKIKQHLQTRAIELRDFKKIELPHFSLIQEKDGPRILNYQFPISEEKTKTFTEALNQIRVLRKVDADVSDPLVLNEYLGKNPIKFNITYDSEVVSFTLGEKPSLTGSFYILREKYYLKELLLCADETVINEIARSEEDLELRKFYRFYQMINSVPIDFVNKKIFTESFFKDLSTIEVSNNQKHYYQIHYFSKTTTPAALKGIKYNIRFFHQFLKQLKEMELINIYEDKSKLKKLNATLLLNENQKIELFSYYENQEGHYLTYSDSPFVYEIQEHQISLFFEDVQAFWLKNHDFASEIKTLDGLEFHIVFFESKSQRKYPIYVSDKEIFQILVKDKPHWKTDKNKFLNIIKLIAGIDEFAQASHVEQYDAQFKTENKGYREFRIEILGKKLDFYVKNLEMMVANLDDRYVLYYSNSKKMIWGSTPQAFFNQGDQE